LIEMIVTGAIVGAIYNRRRRRRLNRDRTFAGELACSLGSTGCQPVRLGSLPRPFAQLLFTSRSVAGKLSATADWQRALTGIR